MIPDTLRRLASGGTRVMPRNGRAVACLTVAVLVVTPSVSSAFSVSVDGSTLRVEAAPGERNEVYVESGGGALMVSPQEVVVRDPFIAATAGPGCRALTTGFQPVAAVCPLSGLASIAISLADGNDWSNLNLSPLPAVIDGGDGDDLLGGGSAHADRLIGGSGNDDLSGQAGDTLDGGVGDDKLSIFGAGATAIGGDGNDRMTAEGSDVVLDGGAGNDRLSATGGGARLLGGAGDDDLSGSTGRDELTGGAGDDDLSGGDGDDKLSGGDGDDKLDGGRGADALDGGAGEDDLDGERGADTIAAQDGEIEHSIACGQGADALIADRLDAVNIDCESVRGAGLPVDRGGTVELVLACPNGCGGTIRLATLSGATLGVGSFGARTATLAARRAVSPHATLGRRGLALVRKRGRVPARATIRAVDGTGRRFTVAGRYVLQRR